MDSFITLIADLLLLPYYLSMEGICKCCSLRLKLISICIQNLIQCFADLASLSKLIGRMLVVSERTHQVGSDLSKMN